MRGTPVGEGRGEGKIGEIKAQAALTLTLSHMRLTGSRD